MNQTFENIDMKLAKRLVALQEKHCPEDIRDDAVASEFNEKVLRCINGMIREASETKDVEVLQHMRDHGIQEAVAILETIAAAGK